MTAGAKANIGGGGGGGGTPSGPAGGDLYGTYPNPGVDGLAGVAIDTSAPSTHDFLTYNGTQWTHSRIFSGLAAITGATLAVNGNVYPCDTTGGSFTVTMPASPSNGAHIAVMLRTGTNAVTIAANTGQTIDGSLASINLTAAGQSVELWYSASGTTWNVIAGISVPPTATGFAASGDLTGNYPNPTLAAVGTAGTYGSSTLIPVFTTDSKGRVTSVTNTAAAAVANNGFESYSTTTQSLASGSSTNMATISISGFTKYLVTFSNVAAATATGTANAAINYLCQMSSLSIVSGGGTKTVGQLITTANTRVSYSYSTILTVSSTATDTLTLVGTLGGSLNSLNVNFHQLSVVGIA